MWSQGKTRCWNWTTSISAKKKTPKKKLEAFATLVSYVRIQVHAVAVTGYLVPEV